MSSEAQTQEGVVAVTGTSQPSSSVISTPAGAYRTKRDHLLGLVLFAVVFLFYAGNGIQPVIFDDNEGLYAGAVKEMTQANEWLLPTNNGLPRIQKPPLTYWPMLLSVRVFGMNEFALRLPNAFFTAAWIYATFLLGMRLRDARYGLIAAVMLATMLGVFVFTHLVQPEPYLATFISLSIYCLLSARAAPERRSRWFLATWICLSLGTLSKGLHGTLWPLAVVLFALAISRHWRSSFSTFFKGTGPWVYLALVVPWYVYMEMRLPGFLPAHFFREQMGSAIDSTFDRETLSIPIAAFYLQHLIFFAPWILFAPAAGWVWWKESRQAHHVNRHTWGFVWLWAGITFATLTFTNLQDYYAMTCWGVAALTLATAFQPREIPPRWLLGIPGVVMALAGAGLLLFATVFENVLAQGSQHITPIAERDTFANALTGISLGVWYSFLPLMNVAGVTLLGGGALAAWWLWRERPLFIPALAALTVVMMTLCSLATDGFRIMGPNFSLAEIARTINAKAKSNSMILCESAPHQSSSLFFYLNSRVHWVNTRPQREFAMRVLHQGGELYLDTAKVAAVWNSPRQIFLIVEDKRLAEWQDRLRRTGRAPHFVLRSGTRNLLSNQP